MISRIAKNALRILAKKSGFIIHRFNDKITYNAEFIDCSISSRKSFSLELAILKEIMTGWKGGVQIGAAGPASADFLEHLLIKHDLRMLLVDGNGESLACKKQRLELQGCHYITTSIAWISDRDEYTYVYSFQSDSDELSGYTSLDSQLFEVQAKALNLSSRIGSKYISTVDIYSFLVKKTSKSLSLLVLDCEGIDLRLLNRVLNSDLDISIIVFEALSIPTHEINKLFCALTNNSYIVYPDVSDVIAVKA